MSTLELIEKFEKLPPNLQSEVVDFIEFVLVKHQINTSERKPGLAKGLIQISDDFDAPLDDFREYMP